MSETIKVLILDGNFSRMPENGEKLKRLDAIKGELLIGYARYKGSIEVWQGDESLYLVSEMPLEEYIEGVVASEISEAWEMEAIKAQAVVARTYALNMKSKNKGRKFHITSSVMHQSFKGNNSSENRRVAYAVKTTAGEILTYKGDLVEAYYHSTCGGTTEDPAEVFGKSYPYLTPVKSECSLSPYQSWQRRIPLAEVENALGLKGITDLVVKSKTVTGRAKEIAVVTSSNRPIEATELRKKLGWKKLPSTNFTLKVEDGTAVFDGKGYGHGVGLCQWGALEMAKSGKTYTEILMRYFPGAAIELYEAR